MRFVTAWFGPVLCFILATSVMASRAQADVLPPLVEIVGPQDEAIVTALAGLAGNPALDTERQLAVLDPILARLTQPTPLRGVIQFLRGRALVDRDDDTAARDAAEESIRLLPGYSGPLLLASQLETYADRPDQAIAYLSRAAQIDPQIVRRLPDQELWGLVTRIQEPGPKRELASLLFAIGWRGENLALRSSLAAAAIEARFEAGDEKGAQALLPHLVSPFDVRALLASNAYRDFWPALEEWAGPRQARLWPLYLTDLSERWRASKDPHHGRPFVFALAGAGRDNSIVDEFLPLFSSLDAQRDHDLMFVASPLADALARLGRWDEVEAMFASTLRVWPVGPDSTSLNLIANRGRLRYFHGDFEGAISDFALALSHPAVPTGEVSASALSKINYLLACSLHRLGRDSSAVGAIAYASASRDVESAVSLRLCLGRQADARTLLLAALADPDRRDSVLHFLQLPGEAPFPGEVDREQRLQVDLMRADPQLLAELAKYGRILPYPAIDGAFQAPRAVNVRI